uniref:Myosin heavy chain fast skeletal muscle n=1 Tax=Rhizophora mucronata TaxID=61149 RepID=A0A2P2JZD3_RHIMU
MLWNFISSFLLLQNECFRKYLADANVANDLALKGDRKELERHCVNQVERVMELWNNSDAFRNEYVRCNVRSTVRRLQTLDGRSIGPDEEPPVTPLAGGESVVKDNAVSLTLTMQVEKPVAPVEVEQKDDKSTAKLGGQKNQTAKSKMPVKPALLGHGLETVSGGDDTEEARKPEHKCSKEEDELARQAEELRKEKEAAKLKEQQILDEKAKAKEAMERKKRIAEKARARAALRAQKEAEEKEREREKRARKKEKRNSVVENINGTSKGESTANPETTTEIKVPEMREKPTATKRPARASQFANQSKAKSIPLPHRNRGKRRTQRWMWTLLIALLVCVLFLMGNGNFFSSSWLQRFVY